MAALLAAGCAKEQAARPEAEIPAADGKVVFRAGFESVDTRSTLTHIADYLWAADDEIAVWNGSAFETIPLTAGAGTATGTFSGTMEGTPSTVAVYPASIAKGLDGNTLTVELPSEYDYSLQGIRMPLIATLEGTGDLVFRHLGAVVKVDVANLPADATNLRVEVSGQVNGTFSADLSQDDPVLLSGSAQEGENSVVVHFNPGALTDASFLLPLPVISSGSCSVAVWAQAAETPIIQKTLSSFTTQRGELKILPAFTCKKGGTVTGDTIWTGSCDFGVSWGIAMSDLCYGTYDWSSVSAGTCVVAEVEQGSADTQWKLGLRLGMSWGELPDKVMYSMCQGDTEISVPLTQDNIDALAANGGLLFVGYNVTLKKVRLVEYPEPSKVTIWEGTATMDNNWNGSMIDLTWGKYDFSQIAPGTILRLTVETDPAYDYWQLRLQSAATGWPVLPDHPLYNLYASQTYLDVTLTEANINALATQNGLIVAGCNYTLKKLELVSYSPVKPETVLWTGNWHCGFYEGLEDFCWGRFNWDTVKAGQTLYFYLALDEGIDYGALQVKHGLNWAALPEPVEIGMAPGHPSPLAVKLSAVNLADIQANGGMLISGAYYTLSKVTIR